MQSPKFGRGLVLGSAAVVALIAGFEGGKLFDGSSRVYADKLAGGLPTVCSGLTKHITDTPIIVGERWSKDKCQSEETHAIQKVQLQLEKCFAIKPPQSVFDAATSFAWNVGTPSVCKSSAMANWNAGLWDVGCERMEKAASGKPVWSYVGGVFIKGLANRRGKEFQHCVKDVQP